MIYLNAADGRKPKQLGMLTNIPSTTLLLEGIRTYVADQWSTDPSNIFFAQNISTHIAYVIEMISQKRKIPHVWVDGSAVRWIPFQIQEGRLIEEQMTYPNYAKRHGFNFTKNAVKIFNAYDPDMLQLAYASYERPRHFLLSHVSRLDGVEFDVNQFYTYLKMMCEDSILIVDGAQTLGAMRIEVEKTSDIYTASTSKFLGGEPNVGIAYISPFFQKEFFSKTGGYPKFNTDVYSRELYSARQEILNILPNYELHIQKLKDYAVSECKKKRIPVLVPESQVSHFLTVQVESETDAEAIVQQMKSRGIYISHNLHYSVVEPAIPLIRISLSAHTTQKDIDAFIKNY